eukprot:scaffold6919_cov56-Attheya_sp.AAC.2
MELTMGAALERESEPGLLIVGAVERATSQRYRASSLVAGGEIYSDRGLGPNGHGIQEGNDRMTDLGGRTGFDLGLVSQLSPSEEESGVCSGATWGTGMFEWASGQGGENSSVSCVGEQLIPIWRRGVQAEPATEPGILRVVGVDTGKSTALGVLGGLEGEDDKHYLTVARANDAEVELEVWKVPGETEEEIAARHALRGFFHQVWRRRITQEATRWLRANGYRKRDKEVVWDAITCLARSEWFDWADGSTLAFWRWPKEWREDMRDGVRLWHEEAPIPWYRQNTHAEPEMEQWLRAKEDILINRRYLESS